jgi:Papain fold toxin 2
VSEFSDKEIYQEVGKIVSQFSNLECDVCAKAVMKWLEKNGIEGKIIRLKTRRRNELFIISNRFDPNESITDNGTHYGVEVRGRVFDNLSTEGMFREDWKDDFHCLSEQFIINELESL